MHVYVVHSVNGEEFTKGNLAKNEWGHCLSFIQSKQYNVFKPVNIITCDLMVILTGPTFDVGVDNLHECDYLLVKFVTFHT